MENNNIINNTTVSHLRINTDEVYEFIDDKSILDILEFVKQSYPFTFIGRQKFRRKIDQLDFEFWIKDANERIVIVNDAFTNLTNYRPSEIEGKSLADVYDRDEYSLVKNITNYILTTSNSVIYEMFSSDIQDEIMQVVEFPICDIDDNVVAIIGFKQRAFQLENLLAENSASINLEEIPAVVVAVTKDYSVETFTNTFYKEFNLNPTSIKNQSLKSIFNLDFSKLLLKESGVYIKIGKHEYHFEYASINNNPEKGYYFSFTRIFEKGGSSEKVLDMLMYTSPDPMVIYNIDTLKFLKVNEAALKLYGYREDEFLRMDLTDLYAPEDIQTLIESSSRNTMERGYTGPWRQKRKDGSTVEVEISKSGIEYNNSRAHLNIMRDISNNIEGDKIKNQFNLMFENISDIVLLTDPDGFIKETSKSITENLGYETEALLERPFLSLVIDDYRAIVNTSIFHSAVPQKSSFNCELKDANGEAIKVELISEPIFGANREVQSFSIIAKRKREVIIEKVVEKEYITEPAGADADGSLDSEFLGHFFHELLTPVNVIVGFSQELADNTGNSNDETKEASEIIKQNQKILLQLIDSAVKYTELEQNKFELKPTNVHFVELIDKIEADVKKTATNLEKEFAYGKISSSLVFETDEENLQILTSFLVEFAMRVTKKERVFLSAYQSGTEHCVVAVKDGRNSISKELVDGLKEIFGGDEGEVRRKYGISRFMIRFVRKLSNILADNNGIIRKYGDAFEFGFTFSMRFDEKKTKKLLAEKHLSKTEKEIKEAQAIQEEIRFNNKIAVLEEEKEQLSVIPEVKVEEQEPIAAVVNAAYSSRPNLQQVEMEESVTTITHEVIEEKPEIIVEESVEENNEDAELKFENLSCLYVEDQIDSQILFKVQMKELKQIEFADSFEKAIPLLQSQKFDFIIMDINLQGEYNGLDALRAIQKMPKYEGVPVVAVTAYVLPGDRERFITAGFNDFISKPILRDKLEVVLSNVF